VQRGGSAREIAALGKLTMLTQRMSRSAGEFLGRRHHVGDGVPAGARHHRVPQHHRRLPERQRAAGLGAVRDADLRESFTALKTDFEEYQKLVSAILDKLDKFSAAKTPSS
jgi:twitching motility protein PilJ